MHGNRRRAHSPWIINSEGVPILRLFSIFPFIVINPLKGILQNEAFS